MYKFHTRLGLLGASIPQTSWGLSLFRSKRQKQFCSSLQREENLALPAISSEMLVEQKNSEAEKPQVCALCGRICPDDMSEELTGWEELQLPVIMLLFHTLVPEYGVNAMLLFALHMSGQKSCA